MNLFIAGMKHCGKSTASANIASLVNCTREDSDDLILEALNISSIRSFYREKGKEAFMQAEYEAVRDFTDRNDNYVLSLGGGAADNEPLMQLVKSRGRLIYLYRDEKLIFDRIMRKGLPAFLDRDDPREAFHQIFVRRDAVYRKYADLIILLGDYADKEETSRFILKKVREAFDEWK